MIWYDKIGETDDIPKTGQTFSLIVMTKASCTVRYSTVQYSTVLTPQRPYRSEDYTAWETDDYNFP